MSNYYDDIRNSIRAHRDLMQAVDANANALADILENNLRAVSPYRLVTLKRKLAAFDAHKKRWTR